MSYVLRITIDVHYDEASLGEGDDLKAFPLEVEKDIDHAIARGMLIPYGVEVVDEHSVKVEKIEE